MLFRSLLIKEQTLHQEIARFGKQFQQLGGKGYSLAQLLSRPEYSYVRMLAEFPGSVLDHGTEINIQIELYIKYAGYIERQANEAAKLEGIETIPIPLGFDFFAVKALSREAKEKLSRVQPINLGQASRISGVSPADISVLMVALKLL